MLIYLTHSDHLQKLWWEKSSNVVEQGGADLFVFF